MESLVFVKLTILGGHEPPLAPKIKARVAQTRILDDTCGYIGDLVGSVVPSRNALFSTLWGTPRALGPCTASQLDKFH